MAAALMQQGSKGAMRDLDYINPRPTKASSALPPDVRRKLGLDRARASSASPADMSVMEAATEAYSGASNAAPKKGMSGAGTDWHNPNGHAFIRRRSGVAMSQRASRHSQMTGQAKVLIANQSSVADSERAPARDRASSALPPGAIQKVSRGSSSRERSAMSRDCDSPAEAFPAAPPAQVRQSGGYNNSRPPKAF